MNIKENRTTSRRWISAPWRKLPGNSALMKACVHVYHVYCWSAWLWRRPPRLNTWSSEASGIWSIGWEMLTLTNQSHILGLHWCHVSHFYRISIDQENARLGLPWRKWLRPLASTAGGMGSVSDWGPRIPHSVRCNQKTGENSRLRFS